MSQRLITSKLLGIPFSAQWLVNQKQKRKPRSRIEQPELEPELEVEEETKPVPAAKKWFPAQMRDDFFRLEKGDTVFISKATERAPIPGAGTLFWVFAPESKCCYCVAESFAGKNLEEFLTYTRDAEGSFAYNVAQSRKLTQRFESLFVNRSGMVPMNKVPVQTKVQP